METWIDELRDRIRHRWNVDEEFTLQEIYQEFQAYFEKLYPRNHNVQRKIQQTL